MIEEKWRWVVMVVAILLMGWLWMSWRNGWFPFEAPRAVMPESIPSILRSLTPTTAPPPSVSEAGVLKQLTPSSPQTPGKAADNTPVLNSLTPKK